MVIDDILVTRNIFRRFSREFQSIFEVDVAIAGAGPAGLVAGKYLLVKKSLYSKENYQSEEACGEAE